MARDGPNDIEVVGDLERFFANVEAGLEAKMYEQQQRDRIRATGGRDFDPPPCPPALLEPLAPEDD